MDRRFIPTLIIIFIPTLIAVYAFSALTKKPEPVSRDCTEVSGKEHIYRGECLPEGFTPEVLPLSVRASWLDTEPTLDLRAKVMVEQLIVDAQDSGMCLVVSSGYRSFDEQKKLYDGTPEERRIYVAKPGESEHQTGLAVDFVACPMSNGVRDDSVERPELANEFDTLPEYGWLKRNANRYGFEQSYTIDNIVDTEYAVESWHWKLILK